MIREAHNSQDDYSETFTLSKDVVKHSYHLEKEFLGVENKEMHLVQDVNQVLTVLVVYMMNERINYEYRIAY